MVAPAASSTGTTARYGVGIIGAGWVAGEYVKVFRDHPLTELVGIYNTTPGKAASLLRRHGVDAKEYASVDELFDDERVNIVASCTHGDVRAEHCVRAAETGRHIVIEKPVGLRRRPGRSVTGRAKAGVKTVVSFVLRWNPQLEAVREFIAEGALGELIYGEADYWHPITSPRARLRNRSISHEPGRGALLLGGCHAAECSASSAGRWWRFRLSPRPGSTILTSSSILSLSRLRFANGAVGKLSDRPRG